MDRLSKHLTNYTSNPKKKSNPILLMSKQSNILDSIKQESQLSILQQEDFYMQQLLDDIHVRNQSIKKEDVEFLSSKNML